jgi:SAM-dependent methyltransferase
VGCGPGYLVRAAEQSGFSGSGVDISATAVSYGRNVLGLDLQQGQAEELTDKVQPPFTVVSMIDTLFHLREPHTVLSQVHLLLGPSGYFFAGPFDLEPSSERIPAGEGMLDVQSWGIPEHLSFVNQKSMSYLLGDLGFVELRFLPMPLTPSDVAARWRFLPSRIAQSLRNALRRVPSVQSAAHALASHSVDRNAGFVLARKPSAGSL